MILYKSPDGSQTRIIPTINIKYVIISITLFIIALVVVGKLIVEDSKPKELQQEKTHEPTSNVLNEITQEENKKKTNNKKSKNKKKRQEDDDDGEDWGENELIKASEEKEIHDKIQDELSILVDEEKTFSGDDFEDQANQIEGNRIVKKKQDEVLEEESSNSDIEVDESTRDPPAPVKENECKRKFNQEPGISTGPPIQYIHIPKAGGTSIQAAAYEWQRNTGGIRIYKFDGPGVGGSSSRCPAGVMQANFLMGHRGYGFCRDVARRNLFTFTAFRDGISRMISLFDYNRDKIRQHRARKIFGAEELSDLVEKYNSTKVVEEGEALIRYSGSQQCRFLCGYDCLGPTAFINTDLYTDEFLLKKATQNLYKLDAIGITEELNDLIYQLRYLIPDVVGLGYRKFPEINRDVSRKSILSPKARKIMEEWAWADIELYRLAKLQYAKKQELAIRCLKKQHS